MDRRVFVSALAGLLLGALLVTVAPAGADNGDNLVLGEKNKATRVTKLVSRGGLNLTSVKVGIPPLTLVAKPGTPPMAVNSNVWVKHLNADDVDGRDANSLARGAFCAEGDATDYTDYSCTMNITAPEAGFIFMSGSVDLWRTADGGDLLHCKFEVDSTEVVGSLMEVDQKLPGHGEANCHTDAGIVVAAGAHTVTFKMNSVGLDTRLADVGAYAFYVPFDGGGLVP